MPDCSIKAKYSLAVAELLLELAARLLVAAAHVAAAHACEVDRENGVVSNLHA